MFFFGLIKMKTTLLGIIIFVLLIIIVYNLLLPNDCNEEFMLYKNNGNCPEIDLRYLNMYNNQDYYQKHPYISPQGQSYWTALYCLRGEEKHC